MRHGRSTEQGFTLIEVMLALMILLVGVLGTVALVDAANATTVSTQAREAGTNLARKLVEDSRTIAFYELTPALYNTRLKAREGLADSDPADAAWTVERRGFVFTVSAVTCSVDDPKDGMGAHPSGFCAEVGAAGTQDQDPEDYRRVTVEVRWSTGTGSRLVRQAGLIGSPGNAAGVGVQSIQPTAGTDPATPTIITGAVPVTFTVRTRRPAQRLAWSVDGAFQDPELEANPARDEWTFSWDHSALADGSYLIGAQAFDGFRRSAGLRAVTMTINRGRPDALDSLLGTRAGTQVELSWQPSAEGDVAGYTVFRKDAAGDVPVSGCQAITATACTDTPGSGAGTRYYVVVIDLTDLTSGPSNLADVGGPGGEGPPPPPAPVNRPPSAPAGPLDKRVFNNRVELGWGSATDPDGEAVGYYVYQDGQRLTPVPVAALSYRDDTRVAHVYWVSAVDARGLEGPALYQPGYSP